MKLALAMMLVMAACSGAAAKRESPLVNEGPATSESCCCKSNPLTSDDGKPVYEPTIRMECSVGKQGECVPDVQCQKAPNLPPP